MSRNTRAKYSKEWLYPLFDEHIKSKEGRSTFCERHSMALHNYNYWWARYREEKGLPSLSKNKGRKKSAVTSTDIMTSHSCSLLSSSSASSVDPIGSFIQIRGSNSPIKTGVTLRTEQGMELRFDQLPPVEYLQQLLNLPQRG